MRGIHQAVAASYAGGVEGAVGSNVSTGWNKKQFLTALKANAQKYGVWLKDISEVAFADTRALFKSGFENEPYLSKDGTHVIKLNNLNFLNDDDTQYETTRDFGYFVARLNAHNELFPSDRYEVIGFAENSQGQTSVVLRQPYIYNPTEATQAEIDAELAKRGFRKGETADGMKYYTDGVYEISDAKPANVLKDADGNLHFIDTDIVYAAANALRRSALSGRVASDLELRRYMYLNHPELLSEYGGLSSMEGDGSVRIVSGVDEFVKVGGVVYELRGTEGGVGIYERIGVRGTEATDVINLAKGVTLQGSRGMTQTVEEGEAPVEGRGVGDEQVGGFIC